MATIHSLPPELLFEVFEHLSRLSIAGYKSILLNASLVCRHWREPSQRKLFEHLDFRNRTQSTAWSRSPARSRYVPKTLDFGKWRDVGYQPMEVLDACSNLEVLSFGDIDIGNKQWEWCAGNAGKAAFRLRHFGLTITILPYLNLPAITSILSSSSVSLTSLRLAGQWDRGKCMGLPTFLTLLAATPLPHVHTLILTTTNLLLPELLSSFSSLAKLELFWLSDFPLSKQSMRAVGACAPATLRTLTLSGYGMGKGALEELLAILMSPVLLVGLCRLELPMVLKYQLAGETGIKLLEECEKRKVLLTYCYGYLTRRMMDEA
ncbi:hypothetical protein RQP46_007637 [Phenoliferia psychrophenolica]